jgi:uncharacterized protein
MRIAAALLCATTLIAAPPTLVDAAKKGDREALRSLIQKKSDVNAAEGDGTTALHWAAYRDDLDAVDLLIRAGAKVNAANDLGVTPLWNASQNGSAAMVKKLLDAGANPNAALLAGETPLMVAARSGKAEAAQLLVAKGANPNLHGSRGQTALMWAASQKHPEVTKILLAHKADVHLKSDVWSQVMAVPPHGNLELNKSIPHGGDTALMFAARSGDLESAKLLVAAGANVNDADAWGVSATVLAAHSNFGDVAKYLLDKGADPNRMEAGFSALHVAVMHRNTDLVGVLIDHGADVNAVLKTWTPTRRSSDDYHFEPSVVGATPLWLAARYSEPEVMRLLLKHGADPKFVMKTDYVAPEGFGARHRQEATNILMAATGMVRGPAWVELPAAERDRLMLECVKIAVELGIDLNAANTDGRTPLDAAKTAKAESVVKFLTEKGAKEGVPQAPGRQGKAR